MKRRVWWAPALLLAPAIYLLSFLIMRLTGLPLPERIEIPLRTAPGLFLMFLIGDTGEELGWTGYATDPLVARWGPAKGGLILGVIWASWHALPFVQTRHPVRWVIWQSLKTVAMRVVLVWIYHKSGKSVLAANLYHVTDNLSWSLFPNSRSHYHPLVTGALTWLVAGLILLGPRTWERRTPGWDFRSVLLVTNAGDGSSDEG